MVMTFSDVETKAIGEISSITKPLSRLHVIRILVIIVNLLRKAFSFNIAHVRCSIVVGVIGQFLLHD